MVGCAGVGFEPTRGQHPSRAQVTSAARPSERNHRLRSTNFLAKQGRDAMRNREVERTSGHGRIVVARSGRQSRVTLGTRARKRLALAVPLVFLAGCATAPRYVQTYCITQPQLEKLKQAEPGKVGSKLDGNAQDDLKTIAGSAIELRSYSDGLLGVLQGCVDPNAGAAAKTQ